MLATEQNWERLGELVVLEQRGQEVPAAEVDVWLAEVMFQSAQYAELVERFEPHVDDWAAQASGGSYGRGGGYDRLLRSLMRLERYDRVIELVGRQPEEEREHAWLVWANLAAGQVKAAAEIAAKPNFIYPQRIYYDDDFGSLALTDEALPVRKVLPPQLPHGSFWSRVELAFRGRPGWTDDEMTGLVHEALGNEATLVRLDDVKRLHEAMAWSVELPAEGQRWLLIAGRRSPESEDPSEEPPKNTALKQALQDYQGWVAIVPQPQSDADEDSAATYRLAAGLATKDALAIHIPGPSRLIAVDDDVRGALRDADRHDELARLGEDHYGWLAHEPTDPSQGAAPRFWRDWMTFVRGLDKGEAKDARICVRLNCCGLYEDLWLRVERVQGKPARYCTLIVTADSHARLLPQLKPGEPYAATQPIHDFSATVDGQTVRGRPQ
jgi:hypothetical protein